MLKLMEIRSFTIYLIANKLKCKEEKSWSIAAAKALLTSQAYVWEPYARDYCKLLRGQNEIRTDFIAKNRGRHDLE